MNSKNFLALALAVALLLAGCFKIKSASAELRNVLEIDTITYIAFKESAGQLTPDEAKQERERFSRLAAAYAPLDKEIQAAKKIDAQTATRLLPVARDFLLALERENVINLPRSPVSERLKSFHLAARLIARRIVSNLERKASGTEQAEQADLYTDEQFHADVRELKLLVAV